MSRPTSISDLRASERTFVASMAALGFGRFEYIQIRGGQLVLNPGPSAVRDIKFATPPNTGKPSEPNTELRPQVAEFFAYVRAVDTGEIRELEVRHGLPFGMQVDVAGTVPGALQGGPRV